jgi:hypothetical protein
LLGPPQGPVKERDEMLTLFAVIIGLCVVLYLLWKYIQGLNKMK